jgi:hypothetical protein
VRSAGLPSVCPPAVMGVTLPLRRLVCGRSRRRAIRQRRTNGFCRSFMRHSTFRFVDRRAAASAR